MNRNNGGMQKNRICLKACFLLLSDLLVQLATSPCLPFCTRACVRVRNLNHFLPFFLFEFFLLLFLCYASQNPKLCCTLSLQQNTDNSENHSTSSFFCQHPFVQHCNSNRQQKSIDFRHGNLFFLTLEPQLEPKVLTFPPMLTDRC